MPDGLQYSIVFDVIGVLDAIMESVKFIIADARQYARDLNLAYNILKVFLLSYDLILSKAVRAQMEAYDESCHIALGNLRNEALKKDKILFSLLSAQTEKKLAEMNENFEVAKAKQEISEMEKSSVQKNSGDLQFWNGAL
ncbi:hypothetical protein ACJX0J_027564, partial [Zea mays]